MTKLAAALAARRDRSVTDYRVGLDASLVALSGRIRLREAGTRDAEMVITELYQSVFGRGDKHDEDGDASGGV
jgi:MoxR-like ATPase